MLELFERLTSDGARAPGVAARAAADAMVAGLAGEASSPARAGDGNASAPPPTGIASISAALPVAPAAPATPADASAARPLEDTRLKKDDEQAKLRYLLALALVRRRRLELVDLAREGGADCLILRRSGQAELLTVSAPPLGEADLERLSRELEAEVGLS